MIDSQPAEHERRDIHVVNPPSRARVTLATRSGCHNHPVATTVYENGNAPVPSGGASRDLGSTAGDLHHAPPMSPSATTDARTGITAHAAAPAIAAAGDGQQK